MIDFLEVSKFFGGEPILNAASLRINAGDRVGIVGPNGAGKSTMFSLLTGEISPDRGTISLPRDLRIAHLRQQLPASANLKRSLLDFTADAIPEIAKMQAELHDLEHRLHTARLDDGEQAAVLRRHGELQSTIEQLGAYMLRTEAEAALSCLGFRTEEMSRPLSSFSGGWQMRAALARVIIARPDLLMLDEPSNYLDIPAVEYLCRTLKSFKGTLLLISHDRFLLRKLTNLTLEVNNGAVTRYAGDYDYYRTEREHRRRSQEAAKRNQDRKKDHMEKLIDRFRAKSSKAAQAKSWQKALDRLEEIELPDELGFSGAIRFPAPPPCGTPTAEIGDLAFAYPDAPRLLSDVNLRVDRGDKIAFVGYNGMGKTTLLKLLVGKLKPAAGRVRFGHQVQIGYQAQEFSEVLTPEQSVFDTVRAALPPGASQANLMNVLGSFGFSGDAADKRCGVLSGGEKIRLSFARIFVNPPNLLVLDEPTTHLDINARELLQEALRTYPGTVCLVSHDIEFVRNTANIIVAMEAGSVRKYFGNYDYYLEKSAAAATGSEPKKSEVAADQSKERRRERARRRNELSKAKEHAARQVAGLESKLEKLENRQQELVAMLSGSEAAPDFAKLSRELATIQLDIQHVMYDWELAAEKLEAIRRENERIHQD